jgi:DNA-binding transcriptional regulator YbjK
MAQAQFGELHVSYVSAFRDYVTTAEQTATMLANCTSSPLALIDRLRLMVQERSETQAYST